MAHFLLKRGRLQMTSHKEGKNKFSFWNCNIVSTVFVTYQGLKLQFELLVLNFSLIFGRKRCYQIFQSPKTGSVSSLRGKTSQIMLLFCF